MKTNFVSRLKIVVAPLYNGIDKYVTGVSLGLGHIVRNGIYLVRGDKWSTGAIHQTILISLYFISFVGFFATIALLLNMTCGSP